MKLATFVAAGGLALVTAAAPAAAQRTVHTTTTVSRVHGPLKIIPHHKRKICRVRTYHHNTTRRCYYK